VVCYRSSNCDGGGGCGGGWWWKASVGRALMGGGGDGRGLRRRNTLLFLFFIFYSLIPVAVAKLDSERGLNPATQTAIPLYHGFCNRQMVCRVPTLVMPAHTSGLWLCMYLGGRGRDSPRHAGGSGSRPATSATQRLSDSATAVCTCTVYVLQFCAEYPVQSMYPSQVACSCRRLPHTPIISDLSDASCHPMQGVRSMPAAPGSFRGLPLRRVDSDTKAHPWFCGLRLAARVLAVVMSVSMADNRDG
jgi:hypothetical protein